MQWLNAGIAYLSGLVGKDRESHSLPTETASRGEAGSKGGDP